MTILINILLGVYVLVALLMVLVILMQRPKSEGLGAAFGGGVTENIFGAQTTNVLTKITGWLAAIFFLLTFALSILYARKSASSSGLSRELMKDLPPAAMASPTASATPAATADGSPTPSPSPAASSGASATPGPVQSASPANSPGPSATPSVPATRRPRR